MKPRIDKYISHLTSLLIRRITKWYHFKFPLIYLIFSSEHFILKSTISNFLYLGRSFSVSLFPLLIIESLTKLQYSFRWQNKNFSNQFIYSPRHLGNAPLVISYSSLIRLINLPLSSAFIVIYVRNLLLAGLESDSLFISVIKKLLYSVSEILLEWRWSFVFIELQKISI